MDRIDRVHRSVLSPVLTLVRANLYHCVFCRLQFYDVRRMARPPITLEPADVIPGAVTDTPRNIKS